MEAYLMATPHPSVIIDPLDEHEKSPQDIIDKPQGFEAMVESINKWAVYVWNYGDNINLAIDEIDMAVNRAYQPPLAIRELAAYGRHNKVGLVVAARRPANIPRSITSQADFIFTFQQHEPGDIKYFKDCGAPVDILTALPKHHFLRRNPEGIWETFSSPWSGGITGTT